MTRVTVRLPADPYTHFEAAAAERLVGTTTEVTWPVEINAPDRAERRPGKIVTAHVEDGALVMEIDVTDP